MRIYYCDKCEKYVELEKFPIKCSKCHKNMLKIGYLSMVGEYLVATELISRNIFAQVTFGNMKKMDLLINYQDKEGNEHFKIIEVKSRQDSNVFWFYGIPLADESRLVIFVDFNEKNFNKKPDFYILNANDVVENTIEQVKYYVDHTRLSTSKLISNVNSKFINEHPDYKLNINEMEDRIEFNLVNKDNVYKFAYLDFKSGNLMQLDKEKKYITMGWGFYTSIMQKYKEQWQKLVL